MDKIEKLLLKADAYEAKRQKASKAVKQLEILKSTNAHLDDIEYFQRKIARAMMLPVGLMDSNK